MLASDYCDAALAQARSRLQGFTNVTLHSHALPDEWPAPGDRFDLIVVSEVCSFLSAAQVLAVARLCAGSLSGDGVLAVCDWRWPFDARMVSAPQAHAIFDAAGLHRQVRHEEADFLLGVWSRGTASVAQREALV